MGIAVSLAILWYGLGKDPFGVFDAATLPRANEPGVVVAVPPIDPGKSALALPEVPPVAKDGALALRSNLAGVEAEIRAVHAALQREDFVSADQALAAAARHAAGDTKAIARVMQWSLLADYARKFPAHRTNALAALGKRREFEIDGDLAAVVDIGPEELVIRRRGQREVFRIDQLDSGVEMAIVKSWFAGADPAINHVYLGVRWLCLSRPNVEHGRREWLAAKDRGAPVESLLPLLEDPVIRGVGR
jgi:hypothetical protein